MVTGAIFNCADGYAYYANSASLRDYLISQSAVIWQAIQYSKQFGANIFDLGEILFEHQRAMNNIIEKEFNISNFKAGFGGVIVPRLEIHTNKRWL